MEQSITLFSEEIAPFLPVNLGGLDWSSRERTLSGHLVESLAFRFVIHFQVSLTEEEEEAFVGALGVDRMEEQPVVKMEGDMEVVDAEFQNAGINCRFTIGSNGWSKILERLLRS